MALLQQKRFTTGIRFLGNLNCNQWRIRIYSLDLAKHIKDGSIRVIFKTMDKIRFSKA